MLLSPLKVTIMRKTIVLLLSVLIASLTTGIKAKSLTAQHIDSVASTTKIIKLEADSQRVVNLKGPEGADAERDSLRNLVIAFYYDQFRHSQDPEAPTFLFMSKSADMLMGIGGVVRMRGWYDWGGAMPGSGFMPYLIPIPENKANSRHLGTTPAGTALFFQMVGRSPIGTYRLYIEANFNGYNNRGFNLKKAYATIRGFTVGVANSTFSDPGAMAPTVDAQGATNKLAKTDILVRYMHTFRKHWSVAVSLENPTQQIEAIDGITAPASVWLPEAAAFTQYQWGDNEHVRLSGTVRGLSYCDLVSGKKYTVPGWAVQFSSVANPAPQITTYITANYGHGYGSLVNDLLAGNYDLIANPTTPGRLYAPRAFGYCLGLQYNFTPAVFASASFSQTHLTPRYRLADSDYSRGWCADINIFWNILPRLQVAAEFDLGYRRNVDGAHRYARRVGAFCQFSF